MALTTEELRRRFPAIGGDFRLTAEELAVPGTEELFGTYLGGPLSVTGVTAADPEHLTLCGAVAVPGVSPGSAVTVTFSVNAAASPSVVAGLTLDVALTTAPDPGEWKIDLPYLRLEAGFLRAYGFDRLLLVLSAEPGAGDVVSTVATVGGDLPFAAAGDAGLRLRTLVQEGLAASTYTLNGEFSGVTFSALGDLGQLVPGVPSERFTLPDLPGLPLPAAVELAGLSVVFTPDVHRAAAGLDPVLAASVRVNIAARWPLIPGVFEIEEIDVEFGVGSPRTAGASVHARLGGVLRIGEAFVGVSVSVPELDLNADLLQPLPLADALALFLPGAQIPTGEAEAFSAWVNARSGDYSAELDLVGPWNIGDVFALTGITLSVQGTATGRPTARLAARAAVGQAALSIEAGYDNNGGWQFSGIARDVVPAELFALFGVAPPALLADLVVRETRVSFDSGGQEFDVVCSCAFPLGDADAMLALAVHLSHRALGGYDKEVSGTLTVQVPDGRGGSRALDFGVLYREENTGATITGAWQADEGIALTDLVAALGIDLPELPEVLRPVLTALSVRYDSASGQVLLTAATERMGWLFASSPGTGPGAPRVNAAAVRAGLGARASDLPLVGESIPADRDVVVTGVQFLHVDGAWTVAQVQALNAVVSGLPGSGQGLLPVLPEEPLQRGLLIWASLTMGGEALPPLVLRPNSTGAAALPPGRADDQVPPSPSESAVVLGRELGTAAGQQRGDFARELDVLFGPVRIRRIGLGYARGRLFVAFDATLALGPVTLDMIGLGLAVGQDFTVTPVLQGAGVRVDVPPLRVTGALEVRDDDKFAVYIAGMVTVETGFFAMRAAGSYARSVDGWSSVFLFGEIAAVGGAALFAAPPFTVTAVSAGFGVNSTLRIPAIAELGTFPLVANLAGGPSGDSPQEALEALADWVRPAEGRYWGAAGVEFTLFKFIATRALAVAEFGDDMKLALLGRTSITFPRDTKPDKKVHARLDIDLKLAYQQSQGLLSLDVAVGAGSFVFDPACRLTGGIAVYIWTAGRHAGDFVITAGGYHPNFEKKLDTQYPHYPRPARLGFVWAPDDKIMVKAQGYTALTPHAFMAGGRLAATYTSGLLSAWFTAYLDVLIQWRPFSLEANLGISIGVAFTIKVLFVKVRVSIEVGIALALWTPPFGGRATVKVWFVSFSFDIGSKRAALDAAEWPEVHEQLPEPLSITPVAGLLADVDAGELAARRADGDPVLVAAAGLVFTVDTVIPATAIHLNQDTDYATAPDGRISIRPMHKDREITSEFVVTLAKVGDADYVISEDDWTVEVIKRGAPAALWGRPLAKPDDALDEGQEALLPGQLAGLRFEVKLPGTAGEIGPVTSAALAVTPVTPNGQTPLRNSGKQGPVPLSTPGSIETIAGTVNTSTTARRAGAYRALHRLGLAPGACGASLPRYAAKAPDYLVSSPLTTTAR